MKPSERMKIPRQRMPEQAAAERARNFQEVNYGLAAEAARMEALRCLRCKNAKCIAGCPVGVNIPAFIGAVAEGDLEKAADVLYGANALPSITGRVCPQETQCEARCIRAGKGEPVAIGYLERFVADWARTHRQAAPERLPAPTGRKVAVVGGGPAGLTCAGELAKRGHAVTIFEALHKVGGVLVYGIPEFRLPKAIIEQEVAGLQALGVEIVCNTVVGQTVTIDELLGVEGFDAVFIANGAGLPIFMGIPGENLKGVYSANEYLTRVNLMGAFRFPECETPVLRAAEVVVVGGGNTAMDAVRTARRLGADPATLVNPVEILGDEDGWVRAVRCIRMELGEPDASGRRRPLPVSGSEFEIPCRVFIEAIGTRANPLLTQTTPGLKTNKWGYIEVDEEKMTSIPGVFAGGDIIRGAATVILAMGDGKQAAGAIDRYLRRQGSPQARAGTTGSGEAAS